MTHTTGADYQRYPTDMNDVARGQYGEKCSRQTRNPDRYGHARLPYLPVASLSLLVSGAKVSVVGKSVAVSEIASIHRRLSLWLNLQDVDTS